MRVLSYFHGIVLELLDYLLVRLRLLIFSTMKRYICFLAQSTCNPYSATVKCYIDLFQFLFYFYLLGTVFLLVDSYARAKRLPPMSNMYRICHYFQVHLPNEATTLQTHTGRTCSTAKRCLRHRQKVVIHFIVGRKLGKTTSLTITAIAH